MTGIEPAKGVSCGASVSYAVTREGEKQGMKGMRRVKTIHSVCFLLLQLLAFEALKWNETSYLSVHL